jgi:hypothetical protein
MEDKTGLTAVFEDHAHNIIKKPVICLSVLQWSEYHDDKLIDRFNDVTPIVISNDRKLMPAVQCDGFLGVEMKTENIDWKGMIKREEI